jgi:hypothetical protein
MVQLAGWLDGIIRQQNMTEQLNVSGAQHTTKIGIQSQTKPTTWAIVSLLLSAFALLMVNVPLASVMMPPAKELDTQVTWPNFRNPRQMTH